MTIFESARQVIFDHPAIDAGRNPVLIKAEGLGVSSLTKMIADYAKFPADIVRILSSAREMLGSWAEVARELDRNIAEELGDGRVESSHYSMLHDGVLQEFGVSVEDYPPSSGTQAFLSSLHGLVSDTDPAFVAGAAYAIEATAVAELRIVKALAENLARFVGRQGINRDGLLFGFLESHISGFELEHEQGLRNSLGTYLQKSDYDAFLAGCEKIMKAMDEWWKSLARA